MPTVDPYLSQTYPLFETHCVVCYINREEATIGNLSAVIDKAEDESLAKTTSHTEGFVPTR